jgi:short-subunit dehydrogenase
MTNSLFRNKIVVITGGNSDLSKSLAIQTASQKADVVLVGNKKDDLLKFIKSLEQIKKKMGRVTAVAADFSTKEGCDVAFRDIKKAAPTFEILINNSNDLIAKKFEDMKAEEIKKLIDQNLTGNIMLIKYALPVLRSNKKPGIINISSFHGKVAMPYFSVFAATQFAFNGFMESLKRELSGDQLRFLNVYISGIASDANEGLAQKMQKIGFRYDKPEPVAIKIVEAYNEMRKELVLGNKERGLIFWNGLMQSNVDGKLKNIKSKILNAVAEL